MYTTRETAEKLNVSEKTIYRWIEGKKYDIDMYITREDNRILLSEEGLEKILNTRQTFGRHQVDKKNYQEELIEELKKNLEVTRKQLESTNQQLETSQQQLSNMQVLLKNEQEKTKQLLLEVEKPKSFWAKLKTAFN